MSKYLKLFETTAAYEAAQSNLILPNVSVCEDQPTEVHYKPFVETRVIVKYNVTSTSKPTKIGFIQYPYISCFSAIEIDGVEQPSVVSAYTFSSTGEHIVKYTLKNPTRISDRAFEGCSDLTSITIPDSVTTIGSGMCSGCTSLTSIAIPDSVTTIGGYAFYSGTSLTTCIIGSGVTSIGGHAFDYCGGITSCTIGNGVTNIGSYTFSCCIGLISINIPSGVTSVGNYAFYACRSLTSITIEATTPPTLGNDAFVGTNDCPIYVPSGSVDIYKAANNWSTYASRIQAIP